MFFKDAEDKMLGMDSRVMQSNGFFTTEDDTL
jgi:hypothetical protein